MDSDLILALQLQEEVNREESKKQDKFLLVKKQVPSSSSIVSPQWEIVDPNPDIYNLFQVFNQKFFWNQLGCVEVKWSNRMYTCAGTTTYKGRQGCIVTLSLPLLKLRPRKDLVETLLHEMIHAYLFVADRHREREEHGPKFHSHMNRINMAAGTEITVYHSFHDEVKYYKNHWWQCNGPCQYKHPYYGLVKRSMNRAPGLNDFWFEEHRRTCGGEFIKVKEPEEFKPRKSKKVEKENSGKLQNLDKFLSPSQASKSKSVSKIGTMNKLNGIGNNKGSVEEFGKTNNVNKLKGFTSTLGKQQTLDKFLSPQSNSKSSSINDTMNKFNGIKNNKASVEKFAKESTTRGFKETGFTKCSGKQQNLHKNIPSPPQPSKSNTSKLVTMNKIIGTEKNKACVEKIGNVNNVHGFKGLTPASGKTNKSSPSNGKNCGNTGGNALLSNRSGTLVERPRAEPSSSSCAKNVTNKTSQKATVSPKKPTSQTNIQAFTGSGHVLNPNCKPNEIDRVKSRLLKIFPESGRNKTKINNITEVVEIDNPSKKPKLEVAGSVSLLDESIDETSLVNCPVCNQQLLQVDVNDHLDECIHLVAIMQNLRETIVDDDDVVVVDDEKILEKSTADCPVCGYKCSIETLNQHLDECLQNA